MQSLNLHRNRSNTAHRADIPVLSYLTGLRIQNHETVVVLTVHLVEGAAHSKQTVRQSLNRLHLTVNLRAEGTAQFAGTHLVTRQESLLDLLAACRLNVREIATGKDSTTSLCDSLNLGVHLAVLTGTGISTGAPLPLLRVAIGQRTAVTCRSTLLAVGAQTLSYQIALSHLRTQEHLSEHQRRIRVIRRTVNVRGLVVHLVRSKPASNTGMHAVREALLITLRGLLHKVQAAEVIRIMGEDTTHLRLVGRIVVLSVRERVLDRNIRPVHPRTQRPGPLGARHTLSSEILPLSSSNVQRTVETHAIRQILRAITIQQSIHLIRRKLHSIKTGRVLIQLLGLTATIVVLSPALTTAANHDPAATFSFLIAIELLRSAHLSGVQPVRTTLRLRVILLDLPAARRSSLARRTIVITGINSLSAGRNRAQRTQNHRERSSSRAQSASARTRRCARALSSGGYRILRTLSTHERKKIHLSLLETSTGIRQKHTARTRPTYTTASKSQHSDLGSVQRVPV